MRANSFGPCSLLYYSPSLICTKPHWKTYEKQLFNLTAWEVVNERCALSACSDSAWRGIATDFSLWRWASVWCWKTSRVCVIRWSKHWCNFAMTQFLRVCVTVSYVLFAFYPYGDAWMHRNRPERERERDFGIEFRLWQKQWLTKVNSQTEVCLSTRWTGVSFPSLSLSLSFFLPLVQIAFFSKLSLTLSVLHQNACC